VTISLAQAVTVFDAGGVGVNTLTGSKAYGSNVTANNLLVCAINAGQNTAPQQDPVLTDTLGNSWLLAEAVHGQITSSPGCQWIFYVQKNKASGANTVTVTFGTGGEQTFLTFNLYEFADDGGSLGGWAVDQVANALSASTVSATAAKSPSAAVAATSNWSARPTGVGAGWTITSNTSGIFTATAHDILTGTGSFQPGFTPNVTSSDACVAVANFYVAPTSGAFFCMPMMGV
jgi:hypothetical protein